MSAVRISVSGNRRLRRVSLCGAAVTLLTLAHYAHSQPATITSQTDQLVENTEGANPHPVHLLRPPVKPLSALAMLGKQIFFDPSLSASGSQSCASCHSPAHAYGPPNGLAVQLGGPHMNEAGYRPPPSLAYLYRQAPFNIGPDSADDDVAVNLNDAASAAQGVERSQKTAGTLPAAPAMVPQGGLFWDGRADTLQMQAISPMLNPVEMANPDEETVARKLANAPYAGQFKQLFGRSILDKPTLLVQEAMSAIARYEFEDESFHSYTSKYDYWLEGRVRRTQAELRGMKLFNDSTKANCAGCHLSQPSPDGLPPLFTDTQYEALGVPRNQNIPANRNSKFFDMGICGPFRADLANQTQYCGMFLTPTLRNTAERSVYFHNGVYHSLEDVMQFYNFRDSQPWLIYPHDASGRVRKYDDLPKKYQANIDVTDAPFDRKLGDRPAMTNSDIQDIIAFLKTLSDGYAVPDPKR